MRTWPRTCCKPSRPKKTELLLLALFLSLLKPGGRAAVIVPDGVLFGSSTAPKTLRGLGFGAALELGISNAVYEAKATIGSLIRTFDLLAEHVVEPYLERVDPPASYSKSSAAFEQIVISAHEVLKGQQVDKSARRMASELLNALQESSLPSPANWGEMMSLLVTARVDLSGQGTETTSVAEWASALDTQVSVLPLVDRLAPGADSADARFLLNGLAIRQQNKPKLEARSSV